MSFWGIVGLVFVAVLALCFLFTLFHIFFALLPVAIVAILIIWLIYHFSNKNKPDNTPSGADYRDFFSKQNSGPRPRKKARDVKTKDVDK